MHRSLGTRQSCGYDMWVSQMSSNGYKGCIAGIASFTASTGACLQYSFAPSARLIYIQVQSIATVT